MRIRPAYTPQDSRKAAREKVLCCLRSFSRIVPQVASANCVWARPMPPERADENIGERGEPQPELVGAHRGRRGAIGEQVALAFFDPVLHVAAGAREERGAYGRQPRSDVSGRGLAPSEPVYALERSR